MGDRLRQISLRQFRERAAEIREQMDIAIRDRDGNLQVIGYYTPYAAPASPAARPLELPVDEPEAVTEGQYVYMAGGPKVIKTPEEAAAAVTWDPSRVVPKSASSGRRRSR